MATTAPTARSRAVAVQDAAIASNVAKIEEAKRSPSAIDKMAARLGMSPGNLKSTLMNTVFRGATDAEFAALIVVADAYKLNPLTKEIYAFPAKGGGIIPVVSVDGWVRIMNEHPQFDGIEFNDIVDEKGDLYAIESVIYRRDRSRPTKVTEYMDECRGNSPAWQKTPKRILRHRALIQGNRIAFGFSGIYGEGDVADAYVMQDGGERAKRVTAPTREQATVTYDSETGEIDEETTRKLDREGFAAMEGRDLTDHGESRTTTDRAAEMIADLDRRETVVDVNSYVAAIDWAELSDDDVADVRAHAAERVVALGGGR